MSRQSKNAKNLAKAREVTTHHKAGKAAGRVIDWSGPKNKGKAATKRLALAGLK